jgi:hypothetical protein
MSHITGTILSIFSNTCNTVKSVSVDSLYVYTIVQRIFLSVPIFYL